MASLWTLFAGKSSVLITKIKYIWYMVSASWNAGLNRRLLTPLSRPPSLPSVINNRPTTVACLSHPATLDMPWTIQILDKIFRSKHTLISEYTLISLNRVYRIRRAKFVCQKWARYVKVAVMQPALLLATGTHMSYRITQCYLPPGRSDIHAYLWSMRLASHVYV